jgi:5-oxoprolinase (ATP-hydrolysing)
MMNRFDPISLEIMWSRLINITEECWVTIWRTAFSTIIGEAQDFGCELLDAHGHSMAHSPRSMPTFNLTLPRAVKEILTVIPPASLADGDVLVTNDPWICAGHLFDIAVVTPVFRGGRLVGLVGSIAHCSDIGGIKDSGRRPRRAHSPQRAEAGHGVRRHPGPGGEQLRGRAALAGVHG